MKYFEFSQPDLDDMLMPAFRLRQVNWTMRNPMLGAFIALPKAQSDGTAAIKIQIQIESVVVAYSASYKMQK